MSGEFKKHPNYHHVEELSKQLRCSRSMNLHLEQLFVFCITADIDFVECLNQCKKDLDLNEFSKPQAQDFLQNLEKEIIKRF